MPKQLQTLVRQGRKVLANLWLKEVLTTRDTCFFFQPPSMDGDTQLDMRQKFHKAQLTWRHFRPNVSKHYLQSSPYKELSTLLHGPFMIAYPISPEVQGINTKAVLQLSKEFNLALMGAKWKNQFLSATTLEELKSENVYRGEILSLFMTYQRDIYEALRVYHEKQSPPSDKQVPPEPAVNDPPAPASKPAAAPAAAGKEAKGGEPQKTA